MRSPQKLIAEPHREEVAAVRAEPPRRLVVELTRSSAADLARFVEEEDVNKTTIVNRALALYAAVRSAQQEGGKVLIREGKTGDVVQLMLI